MADIVSHGTIETEPKEFSLLILSQQPMKRKASKPICLEPKNPKYSFIITLLQQGHIQ
jgi:hypothetical protein